MTEVSGDFAHREIELIDCRAGAEVFASDVRIPMGAPWPLPKETPFLARLAELRRTGKIRDLRKVVGGFGTEPQIVAIDVDWAQSERAVCACEHFYAGTSGVEKGLIPPPDKVLGLD